MPNTVVEKLTRNWYQRHNIHTVSVQCSNHLLIYRNFHLHLISLVVLYLHLPNTSSWR